LVSSSDESSEEETQNEVTEDGVSELCSAAAELIALDAKVIDIFANQALAPYAVGLETASYGYKISGKYYPLSGECEYKKFSALKELLFSVYSEDSGIATEYLEHYPRIGGPAFRQNYLGDTEFCCTYNASFDTDVAGAAVSYLSTKAEGVHLLQYSKGGQIYSFEMAETEEGYRLNDSLLFLYEDAAFSSATDDVNTEGVGSAKTLRGNCLLVNLFVNDGDAKWDASAAAELMAMVERAGDYIVNQGKEYGVNDLSFDYIWKDTGLDLAAPHYSNGASWANAVFAEDGGYDVFVQSLLPQGFTGNYCVMFHFNKQGRSFSVPCDSYFAEKGEYINEFCVMFYSPLGDSDYFACPSLYMHELLHTYGTVDLYEEMLTARGNDLASVYFDKDIMRYEPAEIENCYIGRLTAKLLGWTDNLPLQLKDFLKERV